MIWYTTTKKYFLDEGGQILIRNIVHSKLCDSHESVMRKNRHVCAQSSRREEEYAVCFKALLLLAAREEDERRIVWRPFRLYVGCRREKMIIKALWRLPAREEEQNDYEGSGHTPKTTCPKIRKTAGRLGKSRTTNGALICQHSFKMKGTSKNRRAREAIRLRPRFALWSRFAL